MILNTGDITLDIAFGILAFLLVLRLIRSTRRIPKGLRLPPGPPGKPFVGNAGDMPKQQEWVAVTKWAREYGDLVHVKVFGKSIIFVNSMDIAQDLFEKRSSIYSDRFDSPMLKLMGWGWSLPLMHYGVWWRRHRKLFHQSFHPAAAAKYNHIQTKQARSLLRRLHQSPDEFMEHIRHHAGAIIMEVVYGIKVLPTGDPYIETAEKAMSALAEAGNPGAFLVDTLPILKYVPEWMPGAGFRRKARTWRVSILEMTIAPFMAVKKALAAGTAEPSLMMSLLEDLTRRPDAPPDEEEIVRNTGAVAYAGGSDTTVSSLNTFMLAMVLYPEVQRNAQAELDSVIGMSRFPVFEDRESLPYINAVCSEVLRWHPVVPLGVAHRLMQDDVYGDYFIPGGSIVVGNSWAILHDEKLYGPNTDQFQPERFLRPGVKAPTAQFGFGRRICVGRYLANNTIFITVASILKAFNISPARDNDGNEIPIEASWTSGLISHPEPFRSSIKPRSASAQSLLLERSDV